MLSFSSHQDRAASLGETVSFYGTLLDVVGDELLHRPVQLELDFSAFEEEEVENAAV